MKRTSVPPPPEMAAKGSNGRERKSTALDAETELKIINDKITCLLNRLDQVKIAEAQTEAAENECVVCLSTRASIQTLPCRHSLICQRCFIRTIQVAVELKQLPLRCVLCRVRISSLTHLVEAASDSTQQPPAAAAANAVRGFKSLLQFGHWKAKSAAATATAGENGKKVEATKAKRTSIFELPSTTAITTPSSKAVKQPRPPPKCDRCDREDDDDDEENTVKFCEGKEK